MNSTSFTDWYNRLFELTDNERIKLSMIRWQSFEVLYPDEWTPSKELLELVERRIRPKQEK